MPFKTVRVKLEELIITKPNMYRSSFSSGRIITIPTVTLRKYEHTMNNPENVAIKQQDMP